MGRPLGARIRIRTVFVDYSTAGKCPSFLSRRIHPLRHRIRAFSESSTKKNAGADKGGSDSRFPWNRTIRLRLPANGATVGDHRASGTRLLRRRILRDDFAHILRTRKNETPRHGTALTSSAQVVFASILPWVSFACLEALKRFGTSRYLEAYRSRPLLTKKGMYDLVFLLVAVSLILAALRGTSHLGLWGSNHLGSPVSTPAGYLTVALALTACAYLTLLRNSNNQMLVRYQPAFLVLAGGFLIYVLQNEYVFARIADPVFDWLYLTVELFGHLLSGTMIITAIRSASAPAWLFQGISDSAFGLVAVPWLLLVQEAHVDIRILMAVAIFLVMVAAIRPMSTRPMEIERSLSLSSCEGAAELQGDRSTSASEPTERNEPSIEQRVSETLTKYHLEIAKRHNLSSRESEVFLLLAQGRSRPYICEVFCLSDGTVKTHITHIYRKFDVHNRQAFIDQVQKEIAELDMRNGHQSA